MLAFTWRGYVGGCWRMLADVGDGENEKTENGKCEIEKSEIARLRNCEIAKLRDCEIGN